jgi:hypothetical protein
MQLLAAGVDLSIETRGPDIQGGIMQCPQCAGADFTRIHMAVKADASLEFYSCRMCERKWWERDGGSIALDDVLVLATRERS